MGNSPRTFPISYTEEKSKKSDRAYRQSEKLVKIRKTKRMIAKEKLSSEIRL